MAIQRGPWILLALTIMIVVVVRVRLREMPLERDEGEYAYAGQLVLQGVPPYKLAYNMKLPGTYAAYALIMAAFGQTASGIHVGLLLVNVGAIVLVFLLGRRLLDPVCGAVAALTYGLLAMSAAFLGTAAHATHFVTLFALGGLLLLLRAGENGKWPAIFCAGVLLGLAFVMKQPGITFGLFALVFVAARRFTAQRFALRAALAEFAPLAGGIALPYLAACAWAWWTGVLPQFFFWTIRYAREYASAVPWSQLRDSLHDVGGGTFVPSLLFWILSGAGGVMMWWERRLAGKQFFLLGLLVAGIATSATGFYFRPHYFIPLLPALGLLCGVAVSRSIYLVRHEKSVELFVALAVLLCFVCALGATLISQGETWFVSTPAKASRVIYGSTLFAESPGVAQYIKDHSSPGARIAVLGSEPQICFYAGRRSATGHIYTYGLMARHQFALQMQEEMIREIEQARPEFVVYVNDDFSWLEEPRSERRIFDWWKDYWTKHYELIKVVNIAGRELDDLRPPDKSANLAPDVRRNLMIFQRKATAPSS
jgi:hypothetical protein